MTFSTHRLKHVRKTTYTTFFEYPNKFDRAHHDCKFKFIRGSSKQIADEIMAKMMEVK